MIAMINFYQNLQMTDMLVKLGRSRMWGGKCFNQKPSKDSYFLNFPLWWTNHIRLWCQAPTNRMRSISTYTRDKRQESHWPWCALLAWLDLYKSFLQQKLPCQAKEGREGQKEGGREERREGGIYTVKFYSTMRKSEICSKMDRTRKYIITSEASQTWKDTFSLMCGS